MKFATIAAVSIAVLAMGQAAQAVAPKPSGKFAFMGFAQCEARITTSKDPQGDVIAVNHPQSGLLSIENGYITFTPQTVGASKGNVLIQGRTMVEGGSLRVNNSGFAMQSVAEANISGTYEFTDTTFTITIPQEGALQFAMTHANAGRTVYLVRREDARCLNAITATKQ